MRIRSAIGWFAAVLSAASFALATPAAAGDRDALYQRNWECVPFARLMSGIQLYGDAWTWWSQADGRYAQGTVPRRGAVLVFKPAGVMKFGHVAVVSKVISNRIVMVTHANWSRIGGVRGQAERDVTMIDASPGGDWSRVRVWYKDNDGLGGTTYATYGFIYGEPAAHHGARIAPSPELTGPSPDIVGAVIDSLG